MTNVSKVYRRFRLTAVGSPAGVFVRPVGEVGRPAFLGTGESLGVLVDFVGFCAGGGGGEPVEAVIGFVGSRAGDADTQLDALAELAAERGDDRLAQVAFDLVLHKRRRHRQQGKPLGDDKRLNQLQPGPLLGREGGEGGIAVEGLAGVGVAVEFGNHVVPDGDEGGSGSAVNDEYPLEADPETTK